MHRLQYPRQPMVQNKLRHWSMTRADKVNQKLLVLVCLTFMKHHYLEDGREGKPIQKK